LNPDESAKKHFEQISIAYETLSDEAKKQVYDNAQGFASSRGSGAFTDYHSQRKRRANSTIFSDEEGNTDDEYYDLYRGRKSDRRTMPGRRANRTHEEAFSQWRQQQAADQFWRQSAESETQAGSHRAGSKEQFRKQVYDEFDEFFDFKRQSAEEGVTRDDTRGADLKTEVELEFVDAIIGAKARL